MRTKFLISALTIAAATTLGACAERVQTHGHVIKESQINKIRLGEHSRNDVAQILGTPSTLSTYDAKRWYYIGERVVHTPLSPNQLQERNIVIIDFDNAGKVASLAYKDQSDAQEITPSEKRTRTHGQQLGIIEQAIDNVKRGMPGAK